VEHISLLYTVFKRVNNGKIAQTPNIVLNNLWVENITRSTAMREQVSIFAAWDTSFEDINALKQELLAFVRDPVNSRDFHPDIEVEVVSIAEMNKLELRVEIRHKSNWSNESLRAGRRSKFMCALVVALRKVPIYGPAGSDVGLGDASKPSWSVAISPEEAKAVRQKYLDEKDATRLFPTKKEEPEDINDSTSADYLGDGPEGQAINSLNHRKPGADAIRDDTWNARDDTSTIGRPSTDARPEHEELRGLLRKATSSGRRRQGETLSPSPYGASSFGDPSQPRQGMPPIPLPVNPSPVATSFNNQYAQPPGQQQPRTPASPSSISTGYVEEYQYQTMVPPPRSQSRGNPSATQQQQQQPPQATGGLRPTPSNASTNPYRVRSDEQHPYRP